MTDEKRISRAESDFAHRCFIHPKGYQGVMAETNNPPLQPRNYLGEAFKIVAGESLLIPEREHLEAVVEHCRKLTSAALSLPEVA